MSIGIYKIENLINHKVYIGQSIEIERRWQKHLGAKDDFVIHRALRKYGKENFSFQIIEECDLLDLNKKEEYWITYYNSLVPNGYNMIQGGSNGVGLAKGKKVLQYSLNGEFLEEYSSANQASLITGIDHGSICACCRGKYQQAGGYQWKYSEEKEKEKEIKPIKKRTNYEVLQIDVKTNKVIQEFSSIKEATTKTGIASSTICNVCNGKGKTAGGFKWKYKK
jgi:group I intron endonuclease